MKREHVLGAAVLLIAAAAIFFLARRHPIEPAHTAPRPELTSVGPRLVSNQTSQPLALYGANFARGMTLQIMDSHGPVELPVSVFDDRHAYVQLPQRTLTPSLAQHELSLRLVATDGTLSGPVPLTVVNDAAFVDLTAMVRAPGAGRAWAVSTPTDQLYVVGPAGADGAIQVKTIATADGPSAIALWKDEMGKERVVVAHAFAKTLRIYDAAAPDLEPRVLSAPSYVTGIVVDANGIAYLAETAGDSVRAIDLKTGDEKWRAAVDPNPRELVLCGKGLLAVGSLQAGTIDVLDRESGKVVRTIAPTQATTIVGGGTAKFSRYIMGGKAPRALAWSEKLQRLFVSSIGPNIGPNPERMEVSMNGGVGVIDVEKGAFVRHLGFGMGVPGALAMDDANGRLYAADPALGIVRVIDAKALAQSDAAAADALKSFVELPVPQDFPRIRPAADFGVKNRATEALHAGPTALALAPNADAIDVLDRFTGELVSFELPALTAPRVTKLADTTSQRERRLGQILYYADLGHSAMSCEACHPDGHTEGVFFEKTHPMRIYRSPTVRGARESPPYFTPASTRSLPETAKDVGGRNRYHNPDPTPHEIEELALFTSEITLLPNPNLGADGAPVEVLKLPDGRVGHPRLGMALFEQRCSGCHPAPHYTLDQDAATRGQYLDVGTPPALPLREAMQEVPFKTFGIPPLVGSWDVWPMLGTGSAGFGVTAQETLEVKTRFPLREVIEHHSGAEHGDAEHLTPQQQDDLIAFVLSL